MVGTRRRRRCPNVSPSASPSSIGEVYANVSVKVHVFLLDLLDYIILLYYHELIYKYTSLIDKKIKLYFINTAFYLYSIQIPYSSVCTWNIIKYIYRKEKSSISLFKILYFDTVLIRKYYIEEIYILLALVLKLLQFRVFYNIYLSTNYKILN